MDSDRYPFRIRALDDEWVQNFGGDDVALGQLVLEGFPNGEVVEVVGALILFHGGSELGETVVGDTIGAAGLGFDLFDGFEGFSVGGEFTRFWVDGWCRGWSSRRGTWEFGFDGGAD